MAEVPPQKVMVHVSRHWHNPEITVTVKETGIAVDISLDDLCRAIVADIPHPALTMTRSGLERNILASLEGVLNKAKESTIYV
jgi:hypothetical protein